MPTRSAPPPKTPRRAPAAPAAPAKAAAPAKTAAAAKAPVEAKASKPAASVAKPPKADKAPKRSKPVLVRDGFTMPEDDFALIATLKSRAMASGREAKKSELLRAGLQALAALDGAALVAALGRLAPVKIGRPKKGH